ncbi:MAG: putative membrane protein [Alphaproteobacteria bacterium]|jgi:putative membrane protein
MQDNIIKSASFDKNVKKYWLVFWLILLIVSIFLIPLIPIVVIAVFLISQKLLDAMSAQLYERKLVVKRGVWFKVEKSIPLEKITDVGLTQGPLMRFFNLYRLDFETAGQSAPGALVSMLGIVDATTFREAILSQKDKLQGKQSVPDKSSEPHELSDLVESVKRIEAMLEKAIAQTKE